MKRLALALLLGSLGFGQEPKLAESHFYKLDFVVKDVEGGKVVNSRTYTTTTVQSGKAAIRSVDKVQIPGPKPDAAAFMLDVGVNIDVRLGPQTDATRMVLHVVADISGLASPEMSRLITSVRWEADVVVPLRKPTTVFVADGPASKRQTQLEITATPVP